MSRIIGAAAALACTVGLTLLPTANAADALRVVRDASTGELRAPNAAEAAAFEKAEAQLRASQAARQTSTGNTQPASKPGTEIRYADGTIETKHGEDTHMTAVAALAEDGSLTQDCLPAPQADAWVRARAPASQKVKGK